MSKKLIIAIDGYSSTGKSTLARELAVNLGYIYVDSGAMYRAVTLHGITKGLISSTKFNEHSLISSVLKLKIEFKKSSEGFTNLFIDGNKIDDQIRSINVSRLVSKVAALSEIRSFLVKQQRKIGLNKGIVMDGRDIGTVVFPNADLKIFMTASVKIRAMRRYKELILTDNNINFEDIIENINSRDYEDSNREHSPLYRAKDAKVLDNSDLSQEKQLIKVMGWINNLKK